RRLVGPLEPQQGHPPLTGVAVRVVREVEAAPFAVVEGRDVVGLQVPQRRGVQVVQETAQGLRGGRGQPLHGPAEQRAPLQHLLVGVAEQQRRDLPRRGQLGVARPLPPRRSDSHGLGSVSASPESAGGFAPPGSFRSFSLRLGNRPAGAPLPSQLSRLTRWCLSSGSTGLSAVWRSRSMWKFSTAAGFGPPDPSPNGPEPPPRPAPPIPGPPS